MLNSWPNTFQETVFPAINEDRFTVLYNDNLASRPNTPVNVIVGALLLKELMQLTDEELVDSLYFDSRFQFALRTTSDLEQPFSDRTLSRFRERHFRYTLETGRDLIHEEIEALAAVLVDLMGIAPTMKRMDSLMVASNAKNMSRLEILYVAIEKVVKAVTKTDDHSAIKGLERYLEQTELNKTVYYQKNDEVSNRLTQVIREGEQLLAAVSADLLDSADCQILARILEEQTVVNDQGVSEPKASQDISPSSIQNPSDPDATYRSKAGKSYQGYVANVVETFDENGAIVTQFSFEPNTYSDSQFCQDVIQELGPQEKEVILIADGAYDSVTNKELGEDNQIKLTTTHLTGRLPAEEKAGFVIDEKQLEVVRCPAGKKLNKTRYNEKQDTYRASFDKADCQDCPMRQACGSQLQKKSACVTISPKTIRRAQQLSTMKEADFINCARKRNGVEGVPSVLRRRYKIDDSPFFGLVRSKFAVCFKIGALNVKSLLKKDQMGTLTAN